MKCFRILLLLLSLSFVNTGKAEDNPAQQPEGLQKIELVSPAEAITPDQSFYVGLLFTLSPEYHTYWRGPGVVGVAPSFEWNLPQGFHASTPYWPAPEVVDMVGIEANGYHDEVLFITKITPPEKIDKEEITIKLRSAWMACASSCHPGVGDFALTIPVRKTDAPVQPNEAMTERFKKTLAAIPPQAPENWKWSIRRHESTIFLQLELPNASGRLKQGDIHFFCDDMQVDSDQPQQTEFPHLGDVDFIQQLSVPDFAPKEPQQLSGLLFNSEGWPGIDSKHIEITIPWPTAPTNHE